jgi:hypothetical protein
MISKADIEAYLYKEGDSDTMPIRGLEHLNSLARYIHQINHKWWHDINTGARIERNKGELIALIHSELSETLEGVRKGTADGHLPWRSAEEVEIADTLIRIFDYAGAYKLDLFGAMAEKLAYNAMRQDHTHEARRAEGGKKF